MTEVSFLEDVNTYGVISVKVIGNTKDYIQIVIATLNYFVNGMEKVGSMTAVTHGLKVPLKKIREGVKEKR